jgi:hypothetical protein
MEPSVASRRPAAKKMAGNAWRVRAPSRQVEGVTAGAGVRALSRVF